jgi:two-component system response regulator GlrR
MPSLGRVLIVEDEPEVADMIRDVVASLGYESQVSPDGPDALRRVARYRPDVVLLDLWMPGMTGAAVLDALHRADPALPVVMVTANQYEEIARDTLARGAFDYVRKPFDIAALGRMLQAAMVYRG